MSPLIVIVGRPNVGKSTLFNRLSRSRDALVDDRPGITRDRLHAPIVYDGVPLTLVDTGGFEDLGQDPLLDKVRAQVEQAIRDADAILFLVDGRQGLMPGDEEMSKLLRRHEKRVFLAVNKIDSPEIEHLTSDFHRLGLDALYAVSAAHGYGVKTLMQDILAHLPETGDFASDESRIRVAILGRPNVGKSSLINRILGMERLVVSELPGTTRDAVDTPFSYGRRDYLLIDTAGIRRKARVREKIDKFSMIKALHSLRRCHIAVVLLDPSRGISEQDARICGYALEQGRGVVLAVNKWDLMKGRIREQKELDRAVDRQLHFISFAPRLNVSALTGERVMRLFDRINQVYDPFNSRISTGPLNSELRKILETHPPPRIGRGRLKLLYATQPRTRPPTFVVFVNRPDMVHFSYERFLTNQLKKAFGLEATPIRLQFKKRRQQR